MENQRAYEKVIEHIKQEILSGALVQGQKLPPEREMAESLGVGRNSVREALRTLGIIGVIVSTQGAGNYVAGRFDKSLVEWMNMMYLLRRIDYRQLSEFRHSLEMQAGQLALARITEEDIHFLKETVRELGQSQDEVKNTALDKQLHYRIAQASGNQLIVEILQALSYVMDTFIQELRKKIQLDEHSRMLLQSTHENMVHALISKDAKLLSKAYADHFSLISAALNAKVSFK